MPHHNVQLFVFRSRKRFQKYCVAIHLRTKAKTAYCAEPVERATAPIKIAQSMQKTCKAQHKTLFLSNRKIARVTWVEISIQPHSADGFFKQEEEKK
jgi:hypothetical protein